MDMGCRIFMIHGLARSKERIAKNLLEFACYGKTAIVRSESMVLMDTICRIFEANHWHLTKRKRQVLQVLIDHQTECLTVCDIYRYAEKVYPGIGISTVYRNICLYYSLHILRKFSIYNKQNYYELIDPAHTDSHPYYICSQCGRMKGILDREVVEAFCNCKQKMMTDYAFHIESAKLVYYGICEACNTQEKNG
jgi:Fur family ferric uptake transcriptional regulator